MPKFLPRVSVSSTAIISLSVSDGVTEKSIPRELEENGSYIDSSIEFKGVGQASVGTESLSIWSLFTQMYPMYEDKTFADVDIARVQLKRKISLPQLGIQRPSSSISLPAKNVFSSSIKIN